MSLAVYSYSLLEIKAPEKAKTTLTGVEHLVVRADAGEPLVRGCWALNQANQSGDDDMGLDYKIYFQSVPAVLMLRDTRSKDARDSGYALRSFNENAAPDDQPQLISWLEPNYFVTDKHPDHDMMQGEQLMHVYEALHVCPLWDTSARSRGYRSC